MILPEVPKIDMKTVDVTQVEAKDITITPCTKSVTFKLEGPDGAKFTFNKIPSRGTLAKLDEFTLVWTPDPTFCNTSLGGNDGFVYSWVDPKGNTGVVTKVFIVERQGDVPRVIRTGVAPAPMISVIKTIDSINSDAAKKAAAAAAKSATTTTSKSSSSSSSKSSSGSVSKTPIGKTLQITTITCKKGDETRKVTGVAPTCPTGFKKA